MSDTLASDTIIDLSQARPVGSFESEITADTTSEDEIRDMGDFGVIVVNDLRKAGQECLLFEKDGVKITWSDWNLEVEKNNPDNKKASAYLSNIFYDGSILTKTIRAATVEQTF